MTHENNEDIRIELESRIAFQEKAIADSNVALAEHTRSIFDLQRRLESLENNIRRLNRRLDAFGEDLPNEKPPHY
jgi:uncharacterized coiled-coil protein SlyX